jgi:hypothetical protein
MSPIKRVYISTPLKPEKFNLDLIQRTVLKEKVFAFIPPTEEKNDRRQGALIDKLQIELCDELWVFGSIGRDCSWEAGYAAGLGKPVVFFHSDDNEEVYQNDWMLFSVNPRIVRVVNGKE